MSTPTAEGRHVSESKATALTDEVPEVFSHPDWCDVDECTWSGKGGAHHSAWATLGPLPGNNGLLVRAYVFATDDTPDPLTMISFHYPIDHPEDIANNAGVDEDTAPCLVLPPGDVLQIKGFLSTLAAAAQGRTLPQS